MGTSEKVVLREWQHQKAICKMGLMTPPLPHKDVSPTEKHRAASLKSAQGLAGLAECDCCGLQGEV